MQLIIVESPSKAKTIEKYLGGQFKVDASAGHVRDLPEKRLGVNIKENYKPNYVVSKDKKPMIKKLKAIADKADIVYLATDPDREGEAISWHLQEVLKIQDKSQRIVFNEISPKAVKNALENPRDINMSLVDSQQARRVLDRLVGYKLSPLLCKKIRNGLSAGRVQSVALKMIVDKERVILAFEPKEYWNVEAELKVNEKSTFKCTLQEKSGEKYKPSSEDECNSVLSELKKGDFIVNEVKKSITTSHAPAPFTTSTLQQDSSSKLNMSSTMTMQVAQHLYEGIETATGHLALVTYIRTDSTRISKESQIMALEHIEKTYGKEYCPEKPNFYKSKKTAQDAHEAIRPIDLEMTPAKAKALLDKKHYSLYKLIYERFVSSQMAEAKYNSMSLSVNNGDYTFKASGRSVLFKGFSAIYSDFRVAENQEDESVNKTMPNIKENEKLMLKELLETQKFTTPPARFTEASLVRTMEEKGIGRPSTYSAIISVLAKRKYTTRQGKSIMPTEIAFEITDVLDKYFTDIVDVSFTAKMEDRLDDIENGGEIWQNIIAEFYPDFDSQLLKASTDGDELTDIECEKCGAKMIRKKGRYGKYLACSNYPECSNIKSENEEISDEPCPTCGSMMVIKNGRYGKFLACPNYPKCSYVKPLVEEKAEEKCEKCGGEMVYKNGKFGKYLVCSDCKNTKSLAEKSGICPLCGKPTQKMASKRGKVFFGCTNYPECSFMSWDKPTGEKCPKCQDYLIETKNGKFIKCVSKECDYQVEIEQNKN